MSEHLGIDLWIKRDDLTGFAFGGNKGRKLEYLIPSIIESSADVVICSGSSQSNFVRQLGVACQMIGVKCIGVVMHLPFEGDGPSTNWLPMKNGGNLMIDHMVGMEVRVLPDATWDELSDSVLEVKAELEADGHKPYVVPVGGSSVLGAYSFVQAAKEVDGHDFDSILFASSSGSTHVGLAYHFWGCKTKIIGAACDPEPELPNDLSELAYALEEEMKEGKFLNPSDFIFPLDWVGEGYGIPSEKGSAAHQLLMKKEGIPLDPVYTAKAFSALLDLAAEGQLGRKVCFWHTGGIPALFAY